MASKRISTEAALAMLDSSDDSDFSEDDLDVAISPAMGTVEPGNGSEEGQCVTPGTGTADEDRPLTEPSVSGGTLGAETGHEEDTEPDEEHSSEVDGETPSRKRVRRVQRWKKSKRIRLRNSGKSYTSAPGKPVSAP